MLYKVKSRAASHEENRRKLCVCCQEKKENMLLLGVEMKKKIEAVSNYNSSDDRLPSSICTACRVNIYKAFKNGTKFTMPDYSKFLYVPKKRKSKGSDDSPSCKCTLCDLARTDVGYSRKKNRKPPEKNIKTFIKQCARCLTEIHKGVRHQCTASAKYNNVKSTVQKHLLLKSKEHLACEVIKESLSSQRVGKNSSHSSESTVSLSQNHGRPLTIDLNPKKSSNNIISAEDLMKLQSRFGLSFNTIFGIATFIRVSLQDRKCIEKDVPRKLRIMSHRIDDYFDVAEAEFTKTKGKITTVEKKEFVLCKNVAELCNKIEKERCVMGQPHYKLGIDGGGNFLKICMSIQSTNVDDEFKEKRNSRRLSYNKESIDIKFLDSGVKKLLILGLVESTQENFENVSLLWYLMKLNRLNCTVATDLKLANILIGIMTHASKYPCTWCSTPNNELHKCGMLRTIGTIRDSVAAWLADGGRKERAQLFENCVNNPMFDCDPSTKILHLIPPPQLHLLLGVVNKIYETMSSECGTEAEEWVKECCVSQDVYYGKPSFNGNSCRKLLKNSDKLRRIAEKHGGRCLKYVKCLHDFENVVKACFSSELDPKFTIYIQIFEKSFTDLEIPLTPKIHALIYHVPQFCVEHQRGLAFFSEQAVESVHADFKKTWNKYKVDKSHPSYSRRLLQAVCEYNSSHI